MFTTDTTGPPGLRGPAGVPGWPGRDVRFQVFGSLKNDQYTVFPAL